MIEKECWFRQIRYEPWPNHREYSAEYLCGEIARRDMKGQGITDEAVRQAVEQGSELSIEQERKFPNPGRTVIYYPMPFGTPLPEGNCRCQKHRGRRPNSYQDGYQDGYEAARKERGI